jgi:hypothetical protein
MTMKVWFDPEADFLGARFSDQPGFMQETLNDAVMKEASCLAS